MWYIIIAIIVIVLLWNFAKWLFEFLLEHWQIPLGAIIGFFCGGIGGAIAGVVILYLILFFLAWIAKCICNSNEKKLKRYLKKNCSKLGYVTIEQLSEIVVQFKNKNYNTSFQTLLGDFLNECTNAYYAASNPTVWNAVRGYLENKISYNPNVNSFKIKEICSECSSIFVWTRNISDEKLLINAILDRTNVFFNNYEVKEVSIDGTKQWMVSDPNRIKTYEGENWG